MAYLFADSTGVGMQGPGGTAAEGRRANVAAIANPVPAERARWAEPRRQEPPPWQARYLAAWRLWPALAEALRRPGGQVGMDQTQRWVALSDGASGREDYLEKTFPPPGWPATTQVHSHRNARSLIVGALNPKSIYRCPTERLRRIKRSRFSPTAACRYSRRDRRVNWSEGMRVAALPFRAADASPGHRQPPQPAERPRQVRSPRRIT